MPRSRTRLALALLLMAAARAPAHAQLCFPSPHPVPGLPGAPDWSSGTTQARSDADEPRWAAAPLSPFDSDVPDSLEGGYRVLYDPGANQLVVSLSALTDLGSTASELDAVYFGLSTNAAASEAHAVRLALFAPNGTPDPKVAGLGFVRHEFTTGSGWTQPDGPLPVARPPAWLMNAAAWVEPGGGADWVVSFRVGLAEAGLAAGSAFKIALGVHMHNELGPGAVDLTTPDIGAGAIVDLVQNPHTPTGWLAADAPNAGCAPGIALASLQIGTRNAQPTRLDAIPGAVNRLFATPSIPSNLALSAGLFQAELRVAPWGSVADALAPWRVVPGGQRVVNGPPGSPDLQTVELTCPANTDSEVCGLPGAGSPHRGLRVELSKPPGAGAPVRFTKPVAYRSERFEDLSTLTDPAVVSALGLPPAPGDHTLYLYADAANLPEHGDAPLWLPARAMYETRRIVESPPPAPPPHAALKTRGSHAAAAPPAAVISTPAAGLPQPRSARPDAWLAYTDQRVLRLAWPTYAVHAYYELGTRSRPDGSEYLRLEPMHPFVYHFAHDGPLYGFSQQLRGRSAQLQALQPNLYRASVPKDGELALEVRVSAEEAPLHPQQCSAIDNLKHRKSCACSMAGAGPRTGPLEAAASVLFALLCRRRLRRQRANGHGSK